MLKPFLTAHWRYLAMLNSESRRRYLRRICPPELSSISSAARLITEHYWGATRGSVDRKGEYRVEHPRWKIWPATSYEIRADVAALNGDKFLAPLTASPASAFIADGGEKSSARVSDAVNLAKITQLPALNSQLSTLNFHFSLILAAETSYKCAAITDDRAIFHLPSNFLSQRDRNIFLPFLSTLG